ncbi:Ger(x)C family spore germination protein [Brevibacillus sp. RS1.1]|uniref:Ger(x)C family spore germination protein n=1 Tax=Brevibacillus sp. RS1.1 TaxID=2738982 RepID=UPI00156BB21C|nr:Ger(x)C family spore germination protein [Brevibacillus sp. RS1.1]NRR05151.1 Ger(x)C family spore germination protein [Brevibacillus sp. RS1.1]
MLPVQKHWMQLSKRFFALWCSCVLFLAGCSDRQIFDETGLATAVGYDLLKDGDVRGTAIMPSINPEAKEKIQVFSAIGETSKGIRDRINLQSDKRVLGGQIRVALYNEKLAKRGLGSIVDTLYRDSSISSRVYLCLFEGETYDMLTHRYSEEGNIGIYLYRMIEQNIEGEKIPSSTMHEFFRSYYDKGIDPIMPFIARKGNELQIKGIGLFQGEHYVGWITPKEAFLIKLMHGKFRIGSYDTSVPAHIFGEVPKNRGSKKDRVQLVFDTISSHSKIELTQVSPPIFDIHIRLNARILELTLPLKLENARLMKIMEHALEEELGKELQKVVHKLQNLNVDPAGFGIVYRSNSRGKANMTQAEWRKMFKDATFRFHIKSTIIRNGVMD